MYWDFIRWERRTRARYGFMIPYQNIEMDLVRHQFRNRIYLTLPSEWAQVETPEGFLVELPPVLSYCTSYMMNHPEFRVRYSP